MIRLFVGADGQIVRAGLAALLTSSNGLEVVGTGSLAQALELSEPLPDVLLLEAEDTEAGFDWLEGAQSESGPAIVLLTGSPGAPILPELVRLGISGWLSRTASIAEIVGAIHAAAAGLVAVHPEQLEQFVVSLSAPAARLPATAGSLAALTTREMEVLAMLAEGLGNKEIAWRLQISEHTVKFHVSSILAKLNASSRTEAVALGARNGLILL